MGLNPISIKEKLDEINQKSIERRDDLSEEELRSIFLDTGILSFLGYEEIGKDIRLEKVIIGSRKRTDIQCEDQFSNTVFVIEFKKPSDPDNLADHFDQLWFSYVIPLKSNYGLLFNGLEIIFYERSGLNEHILFQKDITEISNSDCKIFSRLIKPKYDIVDIKEIENYYNLYNQPIEKIDLKEETSRNNFYRNFQLSKDSLFGKLVISIINFFNTQINHDKFLISSYEFWRKSYARKPDKIPKNWKELITAANLTIKKEDLFIFMFCLETAYSLFTRIILAKACEDYKYPHVDITNTMLSSLKLKVAKGRVPYVAWGLSIINLMESMRSNLVESIFEEDIFYWWNTQFMEIQSKSIKPEPATTSRPIHRRSDAPSTMSPNGIRFGYCSK